MTTLHKCISVDRRSQEAWTTTVTQEEPIGENKTDLNSSAVDILLLVILCTSSITRHYNADNDFALCLDMGRLSWVCKGVLGARWGETTAGMGE